MFYAHPLDSKTDRTSIPQTNRATGGSELGVGDGCSRSSVLHFLYLHCEVSIGDIFLLLLTFFFLPRFLFIDLQLQCIHEFTLYGTCSLLGFCFQTCFVQPLDHCFFNQPPPVSLTIPCCTFLCYILFSHFSKSLLSS